MGWGGAGSHRAEEGEQRMEPWGQGLEGEGQSEPALYLPARTCPHSGVCRPAGDLSLGPSGKYKGPRVHGTAERPWAKRPSPLTCLSLFPQLRTHVIFSIAPGSRNTDNADATIVIKGAAVVKGLPSCPSELNCGDKRSLYNGAAERVCVCVF